MAFSSVVSQLSALLVAEHEALRAERDELARENVSLRTQLQGSGNADLDSSEAHLHRELSPGASGGVDHPEGSQEGDDQNPNEANFAPVHSTSQSNESSLLSMAWQRACFNHSGTRTSTFNENDKIAERTTRELQHMFKTICRGRGSAAGSQGMFSKWRKLVLTPRDVADLKVAQTLSYGRSSTSAKDFAAASSIGRLAGLKPRLRRSYSFIHGKYANAISALNDSLQVDPSSLQDAATAAAGLESPSLPEQVWNAVLPFKLSSYLNFDGFSALMTMSEEQLHVLVGSEYASDIFEIRNTLIRAGTVGLIAEAARVDQRDLMSEESKYQMLHWPEAVVTIMIVLNAVLMGVSLDEPESLQGWNYVEWCFTLFFLLEMLLKIIHGSSSRGCRGGLRWHFVGPDMLWNIFDATIVFFAVLDFVVTVTFNDANQLGNLTVIRLARLARLSRLLRVLRLRMFKSLLLLISGAVNGMRILAFALLLLGFLVYFFALLLRFFLWSKLKDLQCSSPTTCTNNQIILSREKQLFSSTPNAMFIVFRCIIGDCQTSRGEPVGAILSNEYGWLFAIPFVLVLLFFQFGLFNLIMAIFVENTLEYAKFDETRRRELQHAEHVRSARTLQALVLKFVVEADAQERANADGFTNKLHQFFAATSESSTAEGGSPEGQQLLNVKVTPEVFARVLDDKSVQKLMNDLDISMGSRRKLFEALDADGNGLLSVRELVDGIMKLRGPADKTDLIGMSLVIRSIQQGMNRLELASRHSRKRLKTRGLSFDDDQPSDVRRSITNASVLTNTSSRRSRPQDLELSLLHLPPESPYGTQTASASDMDSAESWAQQSSPRLFDGSLEDQDTAPMPLKFSM